MARSMKGNRRASGEASSKNLVVQLISYRAAKQRISREVSDKEREEP
jgi:hypothetical protein